MTSGGRADLHLHTVHSDGSCVPAELVRRAADLDFSVVAITDHDTVTGVAEAVSEGERIGLTVIAGVEMSTLYGEAEAHLVGLFVDPTNAELLSMIGRAASERRERIHRITELLNDLGVEISAEDVLADVAGASVGRVHIAEALVRQGLTSSISESFWRYLGAKRPAYVPKWSPTPERCCEVIRGAGGVAVLAHPGEDIDRQKTERFVAAGCRALEAYYPTYSRPVTECWIALAKKLDVGVSGGSDCHGSRKGRVYLGTVSVPLACVDELERRRG